MVLCELSLNPLRAGGGGGTLGLFGWGCAAGTLKPLAYTRPTIMDKSLGTLLRFWGKFQPLPSPHKQCCTRVFFLSTLYRVGGVRTARQFRKGCTVLRGNREMTEKQEYCSTLPRTSYMYINYFLPSTSVTLYVFEVED